MDIEKSRSSPAILLTLAVSSARKFCCGTIIFCVPVKSSNSIDGWDSVLSILQMPYGVPVATVALNGAKNAGILAAQILALHDTSIAGKLEAFKEYQDDIVMESVKNVKGLGFRNEFDV